VLSSQLQVFDVVFYKIIKGSSVLTLWRRLLCVKCPLTQQIKMKI